MNTTRAARVIIGGREVAIGGGLVGETFQERPELHLLRAGHDVRPRKPSERVRFGVAHTTQGIAIPRLEPGTGPDVGRDRFVVEMWRRSRRVAGAHVVIDFDASIVCAADLLTEAASHAGNVNGSSWGLEVCQRPRDAGALIWYAQIAAAALVIDVVAGELGLPRAVPAVSRASMLKATADVELRYCGSFADTLPPAVGLWGHCNVSRNRGPGDPGPWIARELVAVHCWETIPVVPRLGTLGGVGD